MPIFKSWDSLSCFQTQKFPKFGHLGNSLLNKVYCFQAAVHKIEPAKMSSSMTSQSPYSKARSKHNDRVVFQTVVDAKLHADFDESASNFDYSSSIRISSSSDKNQEPRSDRVTTTYLHQTQKGKLIQPFGCLLALDDNTFKVIAYSDNAPEMLTLTSHAVPSVGDYPYVGIGTEITAIFTSPSASALHKALRFADVSILNPILVHCKASQKPFYAIIHRVTGSLIVDLEPVKPYDVPMIAAGALQSYKLAAKAINRLQSLPSGDMEMLCDTMVQEVFELTGYDRVMAYKFHEDDHGEVVAEAKKSGLDPYLGLHYPATDIPQASRFLFMKNKVRMICDCRERNVKVIQDEKLPFDLTFCGSTLRAPHGCHLQYMENMDSIASLVMVVDEGDDEPQKRKRLWGLVVCHHTSPRFVPFPLRYACEFLAQVFAIHINKELELERQILEKNVLRTQTLLCDMLMRDAPFGIVTQNPNIMDLVKCDGAALLYNDDIFRLGAAPAEFQLRDIASWLLENHIDSTGLSTDSLYDAGYPGALALGNSVCGMACVKIATNHLLFWFRAHTAAEIKWGGAKQEDDGTKMHPRSSFRAFLDVVKNRSVPWKEFEVDAIYSLQLIVRNAQSDVNTSIIHSRINNLNLDGLPRLEVVADEMVRLIETANVPIFSVDAHGLINGWNSKISELTGLSVDEALGNHLITIVEGLSVAVVKRMLDLALQGKEEKNVQFEMERRDDAEQRPISLVVNACVRRDVNENIVGVCFVAQDITNQKTVMDKFTRIEGDYKSIVQNPNPLIPPIFRSDEFGWCSEWNPAMAHLSGWDRDDIMDKMMLGEVFGTPKACCRLKNREAFVSLGVVLSNALSGRESDKVPFGFFTRDLRFVECLLCVTKRHGGVFCFLQLASHELQQALHVQRMAEQTALKRLKALAYLKRQIKNPLSGIMLSSKMLEVTDLDQQQKKLLQTSSHCQRQLIKILDDSDVDTIIDGYLELETVEFVLYDAVIASLSQATLKSKEKGIKMAHYWSEEVMLETLYGDRLRLQQILADFLMLSVTMTQPGGHVGIQVCRTKKRLGGSVYVARVEFRISYSGHGVPEELRDPLFEREGGASEEEGISLVISRKLVKLMNGDVQYLREAGRSTFIISVELGVANKPRIEGT